VKVCVHLVPNVAEENFERAQAARHNAAYEEDLEEEAEVDDEDVPEFAGYIALGRYGALVANSARENLDMVPSVNNYAELTHPRLRAADHHQQRPNGIRGALRTRRDAMPSRNGDCGELHARLLLPATAAPSPPFNLQSIPVSGGLGCRAAIFRIR
jgi:hypothetical protein